MWNWKELLWMERLPLALRLRKGSDLMIGWFQCSKSLVRPVMIRNGLWKETSDWRVWLGIAGLSRLMASGRLQYICGAVNWWQTDGKSWGTRMFDKLSDWLEEIVAGLDWAERKMRRPRLWEGGKKSLRLRGHALGDGPPDWTFTKLHFSQESPTSRIKKKKSHEWEYKLYHTRTSGNLGYV